MNLKHINWKYKLNNSITSEFDFVDDKFNKEKVK